jgi:hypothetical protein
VSILEEFRKGVQELRRNEKNEFNEISDPLNSLNSSISYPPPPENASATCTSRYPNTIEGEVEAAKVAKVAKVPSASPEAQRNEINEINEKRVTARKSYTDSLEALERRCPDHVEAARWRQAVEDGMRFLAACGDQAAALGWSAADLFGLHTPPANPHPSYCRLSRYDCTGLVWLLRGQKVMAMTESEAVLTTPSSGELTYRRFNKPGCGPLGDSLDDFIA